MSHAPFRRISHCFRLISLNNNIRYTLLRGVGTLNECSDQNIVHSPLKGIQLTQTTIPQFVFENFGKYPDKIAVECCLTGRKYTFEQIRRKTKSFGKALRKKFKLGKGAAVALILPNIPEFPICLLGALDAGLIVTPMNPSYKPDEIKALLVDSDSKLIITIGDLWPLAQAALNEFPNAIPTIIVKTLQSETLPNGTVDFQECVDTSYDLEDVKDIYLDDTAIMPYSSGTTGLPKGVELSNRNMLSNLNQLADPYITLSDITTENHQDVVPGILPWFHIYGITAILLTNLHNLNKFISLPKFSPDIYLNMLTNHKPQVLYIVPPLVVLMNNSSSIKKEHLQSINVVCSGAAPLGAVEEEKLQKKADKQITLVQGYGLTESSCCVTILSPFMKREIEVFGSVGQPLGSTSVKVVSPDSTLDEPLGPHQHGEILVKGPQIMKAYHNKPKETKDVFVDGWFRTGDIGYYDNNRCFYITDRLKELIKVKGFQVAPAELEELIRLYPGVLDAAVVGVPHAKLGEVPRAYVVQEQGSSLNVKKLEEFVASKVATFKQLKGGVLLIENIPKTASGKILRKDLKLLYEK